MSMSVKQDWQHVHTVAGTLQDRFPASAIQDTSWALMEGNATVLKWRLSIPVTLIMVAVHIAVSMVFLGLSAAVIMVISSPKTSKPVWIWRNVRKERHAVSRIAQTTLEGMNATAGQVTDSMQMDADVTMWTSVRLIEEAVNTLVRIRLAHITASVGLDIDLVRTDTPAFLSSDRLRNCPVQWWLSVLSFISLSSRITHNPWSAIMTMRRTVLESCGQRAPSLRSLCV